MIFGDLVKVSGRGNVQAQPCMIDQHQRGKRTNREGPEWRHRAEYLYVHGIAWMGCGKLEGRVGTR